MSKYVAVGIISLLFVLSISPIVIGYNVNENSLVLSSTNTLDLLSKSSGLENPDKEEGKTELELADINNDGHLDIISVGDHGSPYVNSGEHGIMVWLGNGEGSWTVHQSGNFGYGGCAIGDLNLDGYLDVAWGIHHDWGSGGFGDTLIGAALGDGSGSNWTPWANGLASSGETWGMFATALADFDCNGKLDIISQSFGGSNGLHLYENHGDGSWDQAWSLTGNNVRYTIETCDINADGYPDFVSTRDGAIALLGDGDFGFTINHNGLPSGTITAIDSGDINNDGCDDILFTIYTSGINCYTYDKVNGNWISASNGLPSSGNYYMIQSGDLNGDDFLDIVAYSGPTGYIYLGDGEGNWVADTTWTMPLPGDYSALRVDGDIDHDGREDITVQAVQSGFPFNRNQLRVYSPWSEPTELSVRVTTPHGRETFQGGSIRNIRWLSAIPPSQGDATVEIQLSKNSASGPWTTIESGIPNNGCYQWLVDGGGSEHCRIKVIVTTSSSASEISASDFTIIGGNSPPSNPEIEGPTSGKAGTEYNYTFVSTDPNGDDIWYYIKWGDNTYEEWIGAYESGEEVVISHTWDEEGAFIIQAKAKDVFNSESDWGTLEVTMPVNQPVFNFGFPLFQKILERFPNAFPILRQIICLK